MELTFAGCQVLGKGSSIRRDARQRGRVHGNVLVRLALNDSVADAGKKSRLKGKRGAKYENQSGGGKCVKKVWGSTPKPSVHSRTKYGFYSPQH